MLVSELKTVIRFTQKPRIENYEDVVNCFCENEIYASFHEKKCATGKTDV